MINGKITNKATAKAMLNEIAILSETRLLEKMTVINEHINSMIKATDSLILWFIADCNIKKISE